MVKTLTRQGNSAALIFDKALMELMGIDINTPLKLTLNGKQLVIQPLSEEEREAKVAKATQKILTRHEKAFQRLAE